MNSAMPSMTLDSYFDSAENSASPRGDGAAASPSIPVTPLRAHPEWVNQDLYPFQSRFLEVPGGALHYVDEGQGEPIVFVHGTPTWSFLFRNLILDLRGNHRCIALDHLGFGLSDKPGFDRFEHTPRAHAQNLERLIDHLGLDKITLVVHDFGGPIGLSYATLHPDRIRRIVVINSWAWSNEGDSAARRLSAFAASAVGRFLYVWCNAAVRWLLPMAFADRRNLTAPVKRQYELPFTRRADRIGPWAMGRELYRSNAFYEEIWQRRGALAGIPLLIAWGTQDIAFKAHHLARWVEAFPRAEVVRVAAGHFVQEEAGRLVVEAIRTFLGSSAYPRAN